MSPYTFEDGVRAAVCQILNALDERILICRYGGNNDLCDILIQIKQKLPTVDKILETTRG